MGKTYTIRRYGPGDYEAWNSFIDVAKNATFLFHRDFMDYHADRFADHSLMVFDGKLIVSVLPAHISGDTLSSHRGLTYGGFVLARDLRLIEAVDIIRGTLQFINAQGIAKLYLKPIPAFYCLQSSVEIFYSLFLAKATLLRRDCLSVLDATKPLAVSKRRRQAIRRGVTNRLEIREDGNLALFWDRLLVPNLCSRHDARPVHTADEMIKLKARFPGHIRHFNVYHQDEIVAGTTVFITEKVAHPQYISGNANKNELGSLDFLYNYLITEVFADKEFFDFGPSNEQEGRKVNQGMLFWKESFGAQTFIQDFYEVDTANFKLLEDVVL